MVQYPQDPAWGWQASASEWTLCQRRTEQPVLRWAAPIGDVEYHEIQYKPSHRIDWRFGNGVVGGNTRERIIWQLSGGVEYDVRIRATNSVGASDCSEKVQSTPSGPLLPPHVAAMGLTAVPGDATLALSWNETSADIIGYDVQCKKSNDDVSSWVNVAHSGVGRTQSLRGLTNQVHYDVRVRGTFAGGTGPWVEIQAMPGTGAGRLDNPSSVTVTLSENSVQEPATVTATATLKDARGTAMPAPTGGVRLLFWAAGASSVDPDNPYDSPATISDFAWSESDRCDDSILIDDRVCRKYANALETKPIDIDPGETTATATLKILHNEPKVEPVEGVGVLAFVALSENGSTRYLTSNEALVTIQEYVQPPPTSVTLSIEPARVSEKAGTATVTATLDNPVPSKDADLMFTLSHVASASTATEGVDYALPDPAEIIIAAGESSGSAHIEIKLDTPNGEREPDETLTVNAATTSYGSLSDSATLTITDYHAVVEVGDFINDSWTNRPGLALEINEHAPDNTPNIGTYYMRLSEEPSADVTITTTISPTGGSTDGESRVSIQVAGGSGEPNVMKFTKGNWSTPRLVRVLGKRDDDADDNVVTIEHKVTSHDDPAVPNDPKYLHPDSRVMVQVTVKDTWVKPEDTKYNEPPTVPNPIDDVTINTIGGTERISLDGVFSDPNGDSLVITATSGNEGTVGVVVAADQSSLTVTAKKWGQSPITVKAADPGGSTVLNHFTVTVESSGGAQGQGGGSPQPTAVTLSLDQTLVAESGGTVTVTATLDAPAPDDGIFGFLIADPEGTADEFLDFDALPQISIASGQLSASGAISITNDDVDEDDETIVISASFEVGTSTLEDNITLTIIDDDTAGVTVDATNPLAIKEGGTATYSVVLESEPTAEVTVTSASGDTEAVSVSPTSRTFDSTNWDVPQTFTVSGVSDDDNDDETLTVWHNVTSDDEKYASISVDEVSVSVSDTTEADGKEETPKEAGSPGSPTVVSPLADISLGVPGHRDVSLSGVFQDPDGDDLTFTATSSNTAVATMWVDGSTLTVVATGTGTATITVTAKDSDGNQISDAFEVTVTPAS